MHQIRLGLGCARKGRGRRTGGKGKGGRRKDGRVRERGLPSVPPVPNLPLTTGPCISVTNPPWLGIWGLVYVGSGLSIRPYFCTAFTVGLHRYCTIFTALHGMQTRSSDEDSVCLSVCPSVTRVDCDKTVERSVQIYIPYERTFSLVFWEKVWLMGGGPFYLKYWVNRPPLEQNRRFWTDHRS